jgi:hypothetical protein
VNINTDQLECATAAAWDLHATRKWSEIPEEWKEWYRENMRAALATLTGETL